MTLALALLALSSGVAHAVPVQVGVIRGDGDSTVSDLTAQLSDSTAFDFSVTEVAIADVNSVEDLDGFSVIVLSDSGYQSSQAAVGAKASIFSAYFNAGGGVVATSWLAYWRVSTEVDFLVVDSTFGGSDFCSAPQTLVVDGSHAITNGITDFTVTATHWETPTPTYSDVQVLGTCLGNAGVSYRETDGSRGRTVYLGGLYGARSSYNPAGMRSGVEDQLLEQAVAWASLTCLDEDGDGVLTCGGDCDDDDSLAFPGNPEICDGVDNDCLDGVPADEVDVDGDGVFLCESDCDDNDNQRFPGNPEICDGLDNDCAFGVPQDEIDVDGDGVLVCASDCDDDDDQRFPGNPEICDGLDNDCDDLVPPDELDGDEDGYRVCEDDCDDADTTKFPGNPEICDSVDNDCDGLADNGLATTDYWLDEDGDGYGVGADDAPSTSSCADLPGYATVGGDCDDADALVSPEGEEVLGNDVDEDCDGEAGQEADDTDDTDDTDDSGGCGCSSSTPLGSFAWLVAPLLIGLRRRREG